MTGQAGKTSAPASPRTAKASGSPPLLSDLLPISPKKTKLELRYQGYGHSDRKHCFFRAHRAASKLSREESGELQPGLTEAQSDFWKVEARPEDARKEAWQTSLKQSSTQRVKCPGFSEPHPTPQRREEVAENQGLCEPLRIQRMSHFPWGWESWGAG